MRSLSAHLRRPEEHAGLPFHPGCPVCRRERIAAVLSSEGVVSRRTRAALTAGLLAFSAAAPAGALAAEPDHDGQGAAAQEQVGHGDGANFDPGGAATELPSGAAAAPPAAVDAAALDPEPAKDVEAPVIDPGDEPTAPGTQPLPSSPSSVPAAPVQAAPSAPAPVGAAPTAAPDGPSSQDGEQLRASALRDAASRNAERGAVASARRAARAAAPGHAAAGPTSAAAAPGHAAAGPTSAAAAPGRASGGTTSAAAAPGRASGGTEPSSDRAVQPPTATVAYAVGTTVAPKRGDRAHIIRPGESLWSVAKDVLGAGASSAQIAREVNRLWELNKDSIGTGDPDLLMVGTRLRLR